MSSRTETLKTGRVILVVATLTALIVLHHPASRAAAAGDQVAIVGGTLIDGSGGSPVADALIIIKGDRIQHVGTKGSAQIPADATVIDASGKTILPGLIDGHVHYRDWLGELFLANGVTSVVDLGNPDEWVATLVQASAMRKIRTPRIFGSGSRMGAMPSVRRKDLFRNVAAQKPHFVFTDVNGVKQFIDKKKKIGLTIVKVDETWTASDLKAIADYAHAAGLPMVGHTTDPRDAASAGQDCIMHMWGIVVGTVSDPAKLDAIRSGKLADMYSAMDPAKFPELIRLLVSRRVYINPQVGRDWPLSEQKKYEMEDYQLLSRPELQYIPLLSQIAVFRLHHELERSSEDEMRSFHANVQRFIREFVRAGGQVVAGTDLVAASIPGWTLVREMIGLHEAGMSNMEVIQAATKTPATLYRLRDLGTIEPGKLADILLVRGNPLEDLHNLLNVDQVLIAGQVQDRTFHRGYDLGFERPYAEDNSPVLPPSLAGIEPRTTPAGSQDVVLTVMGSKFEEPTSVLFDGVRLTTELVSPSRLRAVIPAELLKRPGTYLVRLADQRFLGKPSDEYYGFVVSYAPLSGNGN